VCGLLLVNHCSKYSPFINIHEIKSFMTAQNENCSTTEKKTDYGKGQVQDL